MDELDHVFDDHPSLDASLEDFEHTDSPPNRSSPVFGFPSQHSGFREEDIDIDDDSDIGTDNEEGDECKKRWSPPGLRRYDYVHNSSWYRHQPYLRGDAHDKLRSTATISPSHSREATPQFEDALETPTVNKSETDTGELTVAADASSNSDAATDVTKERCPSAASSYRTNFDKDNDGDDGSSFGGGQLSNCRRSPSPCDMKLPARRILIKVKTSALLCAQKFSNANRSPHVSIMCAGRLIVSPAPSPMLHCQ